jgi:hypothetical protein
MKKIYTITLIILCSFSIAYGQITGIKTIPGDYASLQLAIADLNTNGVGSGGATINIAAGYTETPTATLVLTIAINTPTSADPLLIQRSGAGTNPLITAFSPGLGTMDGIFILNGVDYVTINGIDLKENAGNTTPTQQMERGYALLKPAANNGCQNNTIKNCTVTLNQANTASIGIYCGNHTIAATTSLTVTAVSGTHSFNKFYNNTVQNCFGGYSLTGYSSNIPYPFYDQGNEVGTDGVSSNRSRVLMYGGTSGTANGIYAIYQNNIKIFNTYINNGGGLPTTTTLNGILLGSSPHSNVTIYNDTVSLKNNGTTQMLVGINNTMGGSGSGNAVNIYNCVVTGCSYPTATNGEFRGIVSTAAASYTNIYNNTTSNNTLSGIGNFCGIYYSGSSATLVLNVNINNNTVRDNSKSGIGGAFAGIYATASTVSTNCFNNQVINNSNASSSSATYGYHNYGLGYNENVHGNTISKLIGGSGETAGLAISNGSAQTGKEIYDNTVNEISGNTATSAVYGMMVSHGTISNVYRNNVFNITNNTTTGVAGASTGIFLGGNVNTLVNVHNNFISDIKAPAASNINAVAGIDVLGSVISYFNVYHNTVYLNAVSTGANFGTTAILCSAVPLSIRLNNNILVNSSAPAGTGLIRALTWVTTAMNNYNILSGNNCYYAGTPGASHVIFSDGTNNDQTLQAFKNRTGPRDQTSFTELPPFLNIIAPPFDLHLKTTAVTQCESGGKIAPDVSTDYDSNSRYPNPGYPTGPFTTTAPDVGADEFGGMFTDLASPDIQYTLLTNSGVASTRVCTYFANIMDASGINTIAGTRPRLYYKRSTHANTYTDNTNAANGWKYVEASTTTSPFSFTIDYSLLFGGSVVAGDIIQYFVIAQDLNGTPMVGINSGGFTVQPSSVNLTAANFPLLSTINQYTIVATTYTGNINVGPSEVITSLTNAGGLFALLNAGVISGNLTVHITGDLTAETGINAINQWAEEGTGGYTVSIVPSAATTRIISGSHASLSLIRLDGADRVIIDGRFAGSGMYLLFRNTSNAAPTIGFINDAQKNTLNYSIIESGNTATSSAAGGAIFIGGTTAQNGNDNNVISYCDIGDRSDIIKTPAMAINCAGTNTTLSGYNNNCIISNNNIHDWYVLNNPNQNAVNIGAGNSGFTITGNSFYQTLTRTNTAGGAVTRAININFPATIASNGGFTISDNFIGGAAPGATGGNMIITSTASQIFGAITISTGLIPNSIQNNVIRNIDFTTKATAAFATVFYGISTNQGNYDIGNIKGNVIGGGSGTNLIKITVNAGLTVNSTIGGILCAPISGTVNIQNNIIGGISIGGTTVTGAIITLWIEVQGTPTQNTIISNNLIGSTTTANSIIITTTAPPVISYIIRHWISTGAGATISNNTIQNLTNASTIPSSADYGILMISLTGAQGTFTINNNVIKNLTSNSAPTSPVLNILGILVQEYAGTTHDISGNKISGLVNANASNGTTYIAGIQIQGGSMGGTMNKNQIWDLQNANTGTGAGIAGIYFSAGLHWNVNNNMISISNGTNTNDIAMTGIYDNMSQNSILGLYYNSIYVGGSQSAGASTSSAYLRGNNSSINLKNNLLYNERKGGTGSHVAITNASSTPSSGWANNASNYNAFVTADTTKIGTWNSINYNLKDWRMNSGGDVKSISNIHTAVTAAALFVNAAGGDLHINTSRFPEAMGTPVAGTVTDYDGDARSATTPSIGADELACSAVTVSISSQTNVTCNGGTDGSATVLATGGIGVTYSWAPSGGTAATATGLAAGMYTVTVTNICGNKGIQTVDIKQPAIFATTITPTGCDSINVNKITYTVTGTYTQTLQSQNGCDSTLTINATIKKSSTSIQNLTGCDSIKFNGVKYTTTGTYKQTIPNAKNCDSVVTITATIKKSSTSTQNLSGCDSVKFNGVKYTASGTYTQTLINVMNCDSVITLQVTIKTMDPGVTVNNNTITANQPGATYQWIDCNNGNAILVGDINQAFTATKPGSYAVIINNGVCAADTSACQLIIATDIAKQITMDVIVYPNPTSMLLNISSPGIAQQRVALMNGLGQYVYQHLFTDKHTIDMSNLPAGIYFINISNGYTIIYQNKIIKE